MVASLALMLSSIGLYSLGVELVLVVLLPVSVVLAPELGALVVSSDEPVLKIEFAAVASCQPVASLFAVSPFVSDLFGHAAHIVVERSLRW